MAIYGILVDSQTGVAVRNTGFVQNELPSEENLPEGTRLLSFDDTNEQFSLLYAFFFQDPDRLTVNYKLPVEGGVRYDFENYRYVFTEADFSIDIDGLRSTRDTMLSNTDKYMMIPDLPQDIVDDLVAYRAALRNITDNITSGAWTTAHDVEMPEFPNKLMMTRIFPPEPNE